MVVLLPFITIAQEKGADKIIISNTNTANDNFIKVKLELAEQGFEIATQDKDIFQLKTGNKNLQGGKSFYYLIFCKDKQINIQGFFTTSRVGMVQITDEPIQYRKGGLYTQTWKAMVDLVGKFGELSYVGGIMKPLAKADDVY